MSPIVDLVTNLGVPVALVIYFVWRTGKREDVMTTRIAALEKFVNSTLLQLVVSDHHLIREFTNAMAQRPCLVDVAQTLQAAQKSEEDEGP